MVFSFVNWRKEDLIVELDKFLFLKICFCKYYIFFMKNLYWCDYIFRIRVFKRNLIWSVIFMIYIFFVCIYYISICDNEIV